MIVTCRAFLQNGKPLASDDRLLLAELTRLGIDARAVCWDDSTVQWDKADIVVLRSTWDYFKRPYDFLRWTWHIRQISYLYNIYETVLWNIDKRYLRTLEARGIPTIPTRWLAPGERYN